MADKSQEQHQSDIDNKLNHHTAANTTEGGKCLNRHEGRAKNSCSHQWQGFKKAQSDKALYNWPKYKDVGRRKQIFLGPKVKDEPSTVSKWISAPGEKEWDVAKWNTTNITGGRVQNHAQLCNVPYYHEAHHVVPNSTLRETLLQQFGKDLINKIRGGLLDEKYNLNHKDNMILLPMDKKVASALKLPIHREVTMRSHSKYSAKVKSELEKVLDAQQEAMVDHESPKYKACRDAIVSLSKRLYTRIVAAGAAGVEGLDDMSKQRFTA